jgi:hypothetical protein
MGCQCHKEPRNRLQQPNMSAHEMADCPVSTTVAPRLCFRLLIPGSGSNGTACLAIRYMGIWFMMTVHGRFKTRKPRPKGAEPFIRGAQSSNTRIYMSLLNWRLSVHMCSRLCLTAIYMGPRLCLARAGTLIRPPLPLIPVSKPLGPCSATVCTPIYGLHGHSGSWQDRACTASVIRRRDTANSPIASEKDLAHLRMLREVERRVNNADDILIHDPSTQRSTPPARHMVPPLGSHSALLSAIPFGPPLPDPCSGWPAGC